MLSNMRAILEYLGGAQDEGPFVLPARYQTLIRCTVWIFSIVLIYFFSGQSSKFIYIDF